MTSISETSYRNGYDTKVKMRDLTLHKDSCGYYLTASYDIDDRESTRLLELHKIRLGINERAVVMRAENSYDLRFRPQVDIGFGFLDLYHDGTRDEVYFTETVIKEKVREMTLDEIEKKLGHKVKIVNKKGND